MIEFDSILFAVIFPTVNIFPVDEFTSAFKVLFNPICKFPLGNTLKLSELSKLPTTNPPPEILAPP